MTGEMAWILPDGTDSNGEIWSLHAAVAKAIGAELRPFDKYQGPFLHHPAYGAIFLEYDMQDASLPSFYAYATTFARKSRYFVAGIEEDAIAAVKEMLEQK